MSSPLTRAFAGGLHAALALIALFAVLLLFQSLEDSLRDSSHPSGWTLIALSLLLLAFGVRKKLPNPPLLPARLWLTLHITVGLVSLLVFWVHLDGWPDGGLEWLLFVLFVALASSGIVGWLLSRVVPRILSGLPDEVIFERIPVFCRELRAEAETLILHAVRRSDRSLLGEIYHRILADYLDVPMPWWRKLFARRRGRQRLHELKNYRRYLSEHECKVVDDLEVIIRQRTMLDQHHVWQGVLKGWLFIHIPLSWALVVAVTLHVLLMLAFSGGGA